MYPGLPWKCTFLREPLVRQREDVNKVVKELPPE
jgi:hypothetical protein